MRCRDPRVAGSPARSVQMARRSASRVRGLEAPGADCAKSVGSRALRRELGESFLSRAASGVGSAVREIGGITGLETGQLQRCGRYPMPPEKLIAALNRAGVIGESSSEPGKRDVRRAAVPAR